MRRVTALTFPVMNVVGSESSQSLARAYTTLTTYANTSGLCLEWRGVQRPSASMYYLPSKLRSRCTYGSGTPIVRHIVQRQHLYDRRFQLLCSRQLRMPESMV